MKHFRCPENVTVLNNTFKALIPKDTEVIDLSDCPSITFMPDNFFNGLPNLKGVIIRRTNITTVTKATFAGADSLEYIDLTDSRIMTIEPGAFEGLTKLTKLYLGGIPMGTIPPDLINVLPSLTSWVLPDGVEIRLHDTKTSEITTIGGTSLLCPLLGSTSNVFTGVCLFKEEKRAVDLWPHPLPLLIPLDIQLLICPSG